MRQVITYFRNRILLPIPMVVKRNMQIPMDFGCFGMRANVLSAALPQIPRKKKRIPFAFGRGCAPFVNQPSGLISVISKNSAVSLPLTLSTFSSSSSVTCWSTMRAPAVMKGFAPSSVEGFAA